jgi:outer membrane protein assembly factor BamB
VLSSLGLAALAGCAAGPPTDADATRTMTGTTTTAAAGPAPPEHVASAWPMPDADPGRSNAVPDAAGPTAPVAELWTADVGTALSRPVIADGIVYVGGDDGWVRALDARTGDRRWRQSVDAAAGTPWLVDGRLHVPTGDAVVALDPADGAERWRTPTPNRAGLTVAQHGLYWLSGGELPAVVGVDADGAERWRTDIADPWERPVFASAERVFVSSGPHDSRFWRLDPATGDVVAQEPRSGADFPHERFYRGGTVYAAEPFFGSVRATAVADRGHGWTQGVEARGRAAMSGDDEQVYYLATHGDGPALYALSAADGATAWTADIAVEAARPPVVAGDVVLVHTADALRGLDPGDGSERWALPAGDVGRRVVVADDLLFAATDGAVRAFRPP